MAACAKTPGLHFTGSAGAVLRQLMRPRGSWRIGGGYCTSPGKGGHGFGPEWQKEIWGKWKKLADANRPQELIRLELCRIYTCYCFMVSWLFTYYRGQQTGRVLFSFFLSTDWFWQVLLFLSHTCVAVLRNGDFLHHSSKLHRVQKASFVFRNLSSDIPSEVQSF